LKYSQRIAGWLADLGYTHCFYVAGGNIMHLLESLSRKLECRAVIHEVAAGIAVEYFNATSGGGKALALVTAGPGLTNLVTALAGAYLESRELLVIGGQVKTADLAHGTLRQRGIQEIDGVSIARPVTVASVLVDEPLPFAAFYSLVSASKKGRKGPVFLEIPLDIQAREVDFATDAAASPKAASLPLLNSSGFQDLVGQIRTAKRPLLLLGGGLSRGVAAQRAERMAQLSIPVATTWNGMDRIDSAHPNYVGRPNTWGQRSANLIMQQSDLLIALGSRLGMQQTGFNWQQFVPVGRVVQVDLDEAELGKGHPRVDLPLAVDANDLFSRLVDIDLGDHREWLDYARGVRAAIPAIESNTTAAGFISPYDFADSLSDLCARDDVVIPCSSGGAFTVMMQAFRQQLGQLIVTNKGLASMGYGLSGAIGAAFANPQRRVILVEGDGGFAQNLQEIGTAAVNRLNIKIFIFDDGGYASIRMTQRNYFAGSYIGCDRQSGLGLPDWEQLFAAWRVPALRIGPGYPQAPQFREHFASAGPAAFIVSIDPAQTYFPKISSRVTESGAMESNPLHLMSPELDPDLFARVTRFLP
jgi:acetolactate synthase I/II/III large subunit